MQERDEHAPTWPDTWCFPGGALEDGETPREAAARELEEETGIRVGADALAELGAFEVVSPLGPFRYHAFTAPTLLGDEDVECREGRQIVFVDPRSLHSLPLNPGTEAVLTALRAWAAEHPSAPDPDARTFAGVILVDRAGCILLQERDEHPRIDPDKWGLCGGHVEPGEGFEEAAFRELEEETGVRLPPGTLTLVGEFVVDHRHAYGTWDRMAVFVAGIDLTDADIDCREGRQIVFVDPATARGLPLTHAAADVVPAFLESALYRSLWESA